MSLELRVKRRVPEAQLPTRTSEGAAGYDLYSCQDCLIPAQGKVCDRPSSFISWPFFDFIFYMYNVLFNII